MKYVILNIDVLGVDFSNGMPPEFQSELISAGCAGHVPLDMPVMKDGSSVLVVYNCDVTKLTKPASLVYQTDDEATWQAWISENTVQPEGWEL
jgi:hypothetical protein